jgi:uncharacterized protein with HEPN domain
MFVDDPTRLRHMLDAAREAVEFLGSRSQADLDADGLLYHAIKDCITIVGEASYKVSRDYHDANAEIPWRALIRFRHELVHDYFRIDSRVMWDTVVKDFPVLIAQLEAAIGEEGTGR